MLLPPAAASGTSGTSATCSGLCSALCSGLCSALGTLCLQQLDDHPSLRHLPPAISSKRYPSAPTHHSTVQLCLARSASAKCLKCASCMLLTAARMSLPPTCSQSNPLQCCTAAPGQQPPVHTPAAARTGSSHAQAHVQCFVPCTSSAQHRQASSLKVHYMPLEAQPQRLRYSAAVHGSVRLSASTSRQRLPCQAAATCTMPGIRTSAMQAGCAAHMAHASSVSGPSSTCSRAVVEPE